MLIRESCYQRWREIGAPHARALAIATGSRVPMPRVAAAAVVEQTSSAESLDLEPPKETAQEGDSLCQGPKGQKLVKLKRGQLYRMRKRVIQQAVKQTSSIRRQNLMEDLEHGVGMGSNSTAASSSAVEDAKPKAKAKANAKAVAASGEQKEEEKQPQQEGSCAGATPIYAGKISQKDVRAVLAHCDVEATSIRHFRELLEQHMGLAMGALAAEKNMGRLRKLLEKLVPGQEAGVASETTDKGRPQKKTQQNCNALKSTKQFYAKYSWGLCEGLPNTPDQRVVMLSQKKKLLHAVKALKRRPGNMEKIQEGERLLAVYREKAASVVQTMGRYAQYVERIEKERVQVETDRALLLRSISQLQRMAVDLAASHRGAVSGAHGAAEVASELLAPEVAAVSGEGEEMEVEGALGAELLPEQPQRAKHALCAGGLDTRVCGRCKVMLTSGPRKGHPCGRKAPCRLAGHTCCLVMLTRGPRKGLPCGRKAPCRAHFAKV